MRAPCSAWNLATNVCCRAHPAASPGHGSDSRQNSIWPAHWRDEGPSQNCEIHYVAADSPTSTQAGARQSVLRHHWPLRALPSHASRCDRFSELRLCVKERRFPTVPMFRVLFRTLQAPGRSDDANGSTEMNSSFEGRSYAILSFSVDGIYEASCAAICMPCLIVSSSGLSRCSHNLRGSCAECRRDRIQGHQARVRL